MKHNASTRTAAVISVLLLTQLPAGAGGIPRAPRDGAVEYQCVGHAEGSGVATRLYFLLGAGGAPRASWARIEGETLKVVETPSLLIVAEAYDGSTDAKSDYRLEVEFDSSSFRFFGRRGGNIEMLQSSRLGGEGCSAAPMRE